MNTVFGYFVFASLLWFRLPVPVAALFATIAGILFNFKTLGYLVFRQSNNRLFFRFISIYALLYLLNMMGLFALKQLVGVNAYGGALLLLPFLALLSFLLNRRFVFNENLKG